MTRYNQYLHFICQTLALVYAPTQEKITKNLMKNFYRILRKLQLNFQSMKFLPVHQNL